MSKVEDDFKKLTTLWNNPEVGKKENELAAKISDLEMEVKMVKNI